MGSLYWNRDEESCSLSSTILNGLDFPDICGQDQLTCLWVVSKVEFFCDFRVFLHNVLGICDDSLKIFGWVVVVLWFFWIWLRCYRDFSDEFEASLSVFWLSISEGLECLNFREALFSIFRFVILSTFPINCFRSLRWSKVKSRSICRILFSRGQFHWIKSSHLHFATSTSTSTLYHNAQLYLFSFLSVSIDSDICNEKIQSDLK